MTLQEMVTEARQTLFVWQHVPGEDEPTSAQKQSSAQTIASQYLSQGFNWLKQVGESTAAAVFVTLGVSEFSLTSQGRSFFNIAARELDEDAADFPYGWSAVQEHCQLGQRLQPIVEQAKVHAGDFLTRVAFIASRIMPKKRGE